jgi:SSS family solute:Na+ symporter
MIIVAAYALFAVYAVLRLFRAPARDETDYLLAGRRLTLPAFVATTVSTWYGGILGVGEYAWTYGVSNWLVFGAPYYLYALVFALVLAGRARRGQALTMPDLLQERYGTRAAAVGAVAIFVMTVPAPYVLMMGVLVEMALGWPLWLGAVIGMVLSVGYVVRGVGWSAPRSCSSS